MERYFKMKKENEKYNEYFEWYNNLDNLKNKWEQFKKLTGIEAESFVPRKELYIVPTENDLNKFGRFFCKEVFNGGLRKFKANATVQKDWERFIASNKVIVHKPDIAMDFILLGMYGQRIQSRLFHYKDEIYCSIDANFPENYKIPEGYEEIKGSEFHKIMETIQEENNG